MAGVPAVHCICDLGGPDRHRGLGNRSVSLPAAAPVVRLSVLPFGCLYLVPLVLCHRQRAIECCRCKWRGAIGHSMVVFWLPLWFVAYATRTGGRFLLYSDHSRPAPLQCALAVVRVLAFVSFGAIYFIVPRILGRSWRSAGLVRWHFWLSIVGLGFLVFDLTIAGVIQGLGLMDPKVPIPAVLDMMAPFVAAQILAAAAIMIANIVSVFSVLTVFVNPVWHAATEKAPEPILDLVEQMPAAV